MNAAHPHASTSHGGEGALDALSVAEQIALCSGENFWETKAFPDAGIPSLFMCDGPHGLRKQPMEDRSDMLGINSSVPATCFPTAVTTGATWDVDLMTRIGQAIGREAAALGVGLVLGPGANLKRDPLCGRNFEYISEDPYLSGKIAAAHIRGLQANGTAASLKHFALNNQEYLRFQSDSVIDARTMHELYLKSFEIAVKGGHPATVMCAYNRVNGTYCSDHEELLQTILRQAWGFDGLVVTDWGAMHDRIEGFRAGCDLVMPGGSAYMEDEVSAAIRDGRLDASDVRRSAERVLALVMRSAASADDKDGGSKPRSGAAVPTPAGNTVRDSVGAGAPGEVEGTPGKVAGTPHETAGSVDLEAHHRLAREAAESGAVLLKNDGLLPLDPTQRIAWIGRMAESPRYQGTGSSHIRPTRLPSLRSLLPEADYAPGYYEDGHTDDAMLEEAAALAAAADVAVILAGLPDRYESEGFDRDDLRMPDGHLALIDAVTAVNDRTVVVLFSGGAVACPWLNRVNALLYMGLPGQAGAEAMLRLLDGRVNPSGKLGETWPLRYEDAPTSDYYRGSRDALYREGLYMGYRYYDAAEVPVRFPFGHGLSYTTFDYRDLVIVGHEIRLTVTNDGERDGAEIVQLYIEPPQDGPYRPRRELRDFRKVALAAGASTTVAFTLSHKALAIWADGWIVPGGSYGIAIGRSSRDIRLREVITVEGPRLKIPAHEVGSWYRRPQGPAPMDDWEAMLGREYDPPQPASRGQFTMNHSVLEMKDESLAMRLMYRVIRRVVASSLGKDTPPDDPLYRMMVLSSAGSPLRCLQQTSGLHGKIFRGLLKIANGHFWKGLCTMIRG